MRFLPIVTQVLSLGGGFEALVSAATRLGR